MINNAPTDQIEVVVIGNVGIDTNVFLHGAEIDWRVEANFTENLDYIGQAGGYASRGYARLGKRTAFVGYIGDDHNGDLIRRTFARDGIDTRALFVDPTGTSRSVNIMYPDGRRKNFYDGKAHMQIQPDLDLCRSVLRSARLAHFNIPNWARTLLPIARDEGAMIACDLQDLVTLDDPYRQDFIAAADILFFSAANHADPHSLIAALLERRSDQIVIAGMGAHGCMIGSDQGIDHCAAVDLPLPIVDTNGAGDGLAVGFLTSHVLQARSLAESILHGQITARYTCTRKATSDQLITADQIDYYVNLLHDRPK